MPVGDTDGEPDAGALETAVAEAPANTDVAPGTRAEAVAELDDHEPDDEEHGGDEGDGTAPTLGSRILDRVDAFLPHIPVTLLIAYYAWHFGTLSVEVHQGYGTSGFDIGLYDQGVWLMSRFEAPFVTIMGRNLMGDHTSFILLGLVPVYWIAPGAETLLWLQAVTLALAAIPTYLLGLKRLGSVPLATLLAAAFLLHPALGLTNLENYHPDHFLVPIMAFAIYFAIEWRPKWFIVFSVLALLVKEDVVLVLLPVAVWVAIRRNRKIGIGVGLASIAYAVFATQVWMRNLIGVPTLNTWRIPFGGVRGSIETFAKEPGTVAKYLLDENRPWYVWQMLFPTGFVFLVQPEIAATAILVLVSNVTSTFVYQHLMAYHYSMAILPALSLGTVWAISKLKRSSWRRIATGIVFVCSLWSAYLWGLWGWSLHDFPHWDPSYPQVAEIDEIKDALPSDAVVSSYHSYVPHIAHRKRVYLWPTPFKAVYWKTFDQEGQELDFADEIEYVMLPTSLDAENAEVWDRVDDDFEVVASNASATLYKRTDLPDP